MTQKPLDASLKSFYGYRIVIFSFLIMLMVFGAYNAYGVFFTPLREEFDWSRAVTSGAFSLSSITFGVLGVFTGWLNDKTGPRVVLTLCGVLTGVGYILMAQVSTAWQLYLFFGVFVGAGAGGTWVPLMSTVAKWFVARRSMMTGIVLAGLSIGGLITASAATSLIDAYGWRKSYILLGGSVLVIVILAAQFLRSDPARMGQSPYYGIGKTEKRTATITPDSSLATAARTRQFWLLLTMLFCEGFLLMTLTVHLVPHIIVLGFSPAGAATIFGAMSGLSIAGRIGLGNLGDRIGYRKVYIVGFAIDLLAFIWLLQADSVWELYLFSLLFGFAYGGIGTMESPLVARLFGLTSHGLIYGVLQLGYTVGASIGPFLAGYIFDVTYSYLWAFVICAFISLFGIIITTALRPLKGSGVRI